MQKWIVKVWDWIKCAFWWFIDLFRTRYEVTVSFNKEWGDADDRSYIAKKISTQKEKHLKFTTEDNEVVEYRSCLLYTSPSPRDVEESRMPSSA